MRFEDHGRLKFQADPGKADFYAALNMEFSDGWVLTDGGNRNFDPPPGTPIPITSLSSMAEVTPIANGFQVKGTAIVYA